MFLVSSIGYLNAEDVFLRPNKLSSNVFLELPPVLSHYVEAERNLWIRGNPKRGRISLLNRSGNFVDLEAQAVERRRLLHYMGQGRFRPFRYAVGYEQGRRDGARHYQAFGENARLALQAALVFCQLQGRFAADPIKFEFDLESRTLYREVVLNSCSEAVVHRMTLSDPEGCVCWGTSGYLAGHVSEILGQRIITMEQECMCHGAEACRFISRLDGEWGPEADWVRSALDLDSVDEELKRRDELITTAQKAARKAQLSLSELSRRMRSDLLLEMVVADSEVMDGVVKRAHQHMESQAPLVLVGEPGTGRETFARAIHYGGVRKKKPFVLVDSAGLGEPLLKQELFGFVKGAIVGVTHGLTGALARAKGGTLFLNDLASLSSDLQGELLRAMDEKRFLPIGGTKPQKFEARVMGVALEEPASLFKKGVLREDFHYALSVGVIELPPLRERGTDVLRLAEVFLRQFRSAHQQPSANMSQEFCQVLQECAWPGNVRQLRNVMEHAVILSQGRALEPGDLPDEILASRWTKAPQTLTAEVIQAALNRCRGNRTHAALLLGVGRTTLWRAMTKFGIE